MSFDEKYVSEAQKKHAEKIIQAVRKEFDLRTPEYTIMGLNPWKGIKEMEESEGVKIVFENKEVANEIKVIKKGPLEEAFRSVIRWTAFDQWHPDNRILKERQDLWDLVGCLDAYWNQLADPLCIGVFNTAGGAIYLGIRSTRQFPGDEDSAFDLEADQRSRWDALLRAKCATYGLPFQPPRFTIFRDASPY